MCANDQCVYKKGKTLLTHHVDDLLLFVTGDDTETKEQFEKNLTKKWKITGGNKADFFFNTNIKQNKGRIQVRQDALIKTIGDCWSNNELDKLEYTPLPPRATIKIEDCLQDDEIYEHRDEIKHFRRILGKIGFLSQVSRPDCQAAYRELSTIMTKPGVIHWQLLLHLSRYVWTTKHLQISYERTQSTIRNKPIFYSDASDKTQLYGYLGMLNGGPIIWKQGRLPFNATSSQDAEIHGGSECSRQIIHTRNLMMEMGRIQMEPTILYMDSEPALSMLKDFKISDKTMHINRRFMNTPIWIKQRKIQAKKILGTDNPSDIFTKFEVKKVINRHVYSIFGQRTDE